MGNTLAGDRKFLAPFLFLAGLIGLAASFELMVSKIAVLQDPQADLSCDFSLLVQCGANLVSNQGEVFGFPNPILGLMGFMAPIVVGAALLAGARFANWFWILFNIGILGGLALVIWLISQSIYVLGVLCPWCMVVWSVTIPIFWAVTLRNMAAGVFGDGLRRLGSSLLTWIVLIVLGCYLVIALLAQFQLNVLLYL